MVSSNLWRMVAIAVTITTAQRASSQEDGCRISAVRGGAATIERAGIASSLQQGEVVMRRDRIATGEETRVTITCEYGAQIVIGPGATVDLAGVTTPSSSPGPVMRLLNGAAGFLMSLRGGARFGVRTPSAVAAVRSTQWAMVVEGGETAVFVREGAVDIRGGNGEVTLQATQGVDVAADGTLGAVVIWGQQRVEALDVSLGPDWRP